MIRFLQPAPFLLLALLLALPAVALGQGSSGSDEEVEGDDDDSAEPDAPPEMSRKLKKALKQVKKKEWPLASLSLHKVLQSEDYEDVYYHVNVRFYLAFCLEQMGLPYSALEEYNRYLLGADNENELLAKAIERSVSLGRQVDAGWILAPGLAHLDTSVVSTGYQGPAMYWVGKWHYEQGNHMVARAYLSLVPKDTEFYVHARMLEGISYTVEGKPVEAIAPLTAAYQAADPLADDNTWEVVNVNLGRAYYSVGNFERAIEHFEKTPRSSPLWFETLYEASWSYFRLGRLSGALSHLQTVDSPFFDGMYHPEATLLRILLFYYLCKYITGQEMLIEFTEDHYPLLEDLEDAIKKAEADPEKLFEALYTWKTARKDAGLKLPGPVKQWFATDEELVHIGEYLEGIDDELARVDRIRTGWEKSSLRQELERSLKERKRVAVEDKGNEALAKLRIMWAQLGSHLGNAELYKVEMLTAEKEIYDAAYQGRLMDKIATRAAERAVPEGYRYWPFEGEYWLDEIGWYEVNTINECLVIQK
jgi:tetratricopeptide (TPR) repeat protein